MKKILLGILAVVAIAVAAILMFFKNDGKDPYADSEQTQEKEQITWGKFGGEHDANNKPDEKHGSSFQKCDYTVPDNEIPTFTDIDLDFENKFDPKKSLPIMAMRRARAPVSMTRLDRFGASAIKET